MKVLATLIAILSIAILSFPKASAPATRVATKKLSTTQVIYRVFGEYGYQAVRVARCESGLSIWAHNGQYLGLFQMGSWARARYGHGWSTWAQSRAAYRYFIASGRDWSPWTCKP